MVEVTTAIVMDCPPDVVSQYAADPDNAPEWYVNIKKVEWQTPKPLSVGSKIAFKAWFLGKELAYVYEIAEYEPGRCLVMRTADGPFPMETTYRWESVGERSTRMILKNKGKPEGFSVLFSPFMSLMMRRANKKDLERIKDILETGMRKGS